jgi:segregation and condensation protein B
MLRALIEAAVLTSGKPVTLHSLATLVDEHDGDVEPEDLILDHLKSIQSDWDQEASGIRIEQVAGGWRCITPAHLDPYLKVFHRVEAKHRLSQAALEVLAIVAHRQPVTLPEVNFIRGANSSAVMRTLMERKLVRMAGRKKVIGKPFLYRTTQDFLIHFGLDRVEDLPDPEQLLATDDDTIPQDVELPD